MSILNKPASEYERLSKELKRFKDVQADADKIVNEIGNEKQKVLDNIEVALTDKEWLELINKEFKRVYDWFEDDMYLRVLHFYDLEGLHREIKEKYHSEITKKKLKKIKEVCEE